jgi:hypothetical protein
MCGAVRETVVEGAPFPNNRRLKERFGAKQKDVEGKISRKIYTEIFWANARRALGWGAVGLRQP